MTTAFLAPVPAASIAWMAFSLLAAVGLPIALCIIVKRKLHAALSPVFIGAATFIIAVNVAESFAHSLILSTAAGAAIKGSTWLYAVYGGAMAALFEELARLGAMRLLMKNKLTRENALMYGVGHGGIEAIMTVGLLYLSNLVTSVMINTGAIASAFAALDADAAQTLAAQLSALSETRPTLFAAAGVERISAIALHICLSYLVYRAARYGERRYLALALAAHFAVDALAVLLSKYASIAALESIVLIAVALLAVYAARLYRAEGAADTADATGTPAARSAASASTEVGSSTGAAME